MSYQDALQSWTAAAGPILERVAGIYHATITYLELGEQVQDRSGIRTRMLLMNWIGSVLGGVSRHAHTNGQPLLSALCVRADGTIGDGYAIAVRENYGQQPEDLEMHAAPERLRCYQFFGAALPQGGGIPALTPQVAARRAARAARTLPDLPSKPSCPSCYLTLPVTGVCDNCS
ncbi:MAG: hypothetical protein JO345_29240 [Streptosporangiaceae bacterium]|nr:hypothetical protein [Streptosporangiaceae bacterium]